MGKINEHFQGLFWSKSKRKRTNQSLSRIQVSPSEIAYIGDDINDLELMKKVGFSATPHDGIDEAKKVASYICKKSGGGGALREIADLILKERFPQKTRWY